MRVLLFGTYDTSMHPRVATIAEGLRARGADVAECNAPLGLGTAARVDMLAHPWRVAALLVRLARRWATLARAARRMPAPDVVVVGYLGHFDVHLARLIFRRVPVVLDHLVGASDTARDRRLNGGLRQVLLRIIDSAALRAADIIVVDTDEHLAALPPRHRARAVVVPVGAPAAWLGAARAPGARAPGARAPDARAPGGRDSSGPLRVVFYGLYTPLQGTPVIGAALGRIAGAPIEVTMIGSGQDEAETKAAAAANHAVRWLDWVPAADLPAVVASHDVCLGIFGTGDKALRVVPNKAFQGAAAGCAVVTSDTAPQRRTLGDAAVLVPPGDPGALAAALLRLSADRAELARLRQQAHRLAQQRFAPERIVAPLVQKLVPGTAHAQSRDLHDEEFGMVSATASRSRVNVNAVAPLTPNAWLRYDVIRHLIPAGVTDVLEIGCGQGSLGARLARNYRYVGVEPDQTSCAVAQRRISAAGGGEVRNVAFDALGDEQFDLVCAFEVLEHIEDDVTTLKEWASRLRPGGWLLFSVPAHQRRFAPADELAGHFRRYDPEPLAALLASRGFTDIAIRQYGFPLGYLLEAGRNQIARRRLAASAGQSLAERTAGSGRLLQPSSGTTGAVTRWGTAPFRVLQRAFPNTGTGLVALARLAG
jgi:2-polyprenyl-3-methyl-5-hydroxy-6-metoxy-1,4-benzoquinol methylase/glycosyltransferase involved in cell wall biosynthesis